MNALIFALYDDPVEKMTQKYKFQSLSSKSLMCKYGFLFHDTDKTISMQKENLLAYAFFSLRTHSLLQ